MDKYEGKKSVLLLILKILMGKTNRSQMLSEKEIEDKIYDNHDVLIERKQFYRCIDKLRTAGFPIKKVKGSAARYYYDGIMFRTTDTIYLSHLINQSNDISIKEKEEFIKRLELNPFIEDRWSYNPFIKLDGLKETGIEYFTLDNFYTIYNAYKENFKIQYKIYKNDIISELLEGYVDDINLSEEKIKIIINNSKYYINEIINVKILK